MVSLRSVGFLCCAVGAMYVANRERSALAERAVPGTAVESAGSTGAADNQASYLRLLSYNIELGLRGDACRQIGELLISVRPDIICLQEAAWKEPPGSDSESDQVAYLADTLGYEWTRVRRGRVRSREYGVAVLSRGKILSARDLKIDREAPHAVLAELLIDGHRLFVCSIHARSLGGDELVQAFAATEPVRTAQARRVVAELPVLDSPLVLAGDFNTLAYSPSYNVLAEHLLDAASGSANDGKFTRLTGFLPLRIDFVFVPPGAGVLDYDVLPVDYSDHRPVVVRFTLPSTSATR